MTAVTDEENTTVVATYNGQNLEELIGFIEEEYQCVYCGVNGTLYAGTDGLAFLGKFFLFDKKIILKWVDVKVQQTDHGIAIQTRDENLVVHEFMGIQKPERCWGILVSLHNRAILDRTKEPERVAATTGEGIEGAKADVRPMSASVQPLRRKTMRRMTSDPAKLAPSIEALFSDSNKEDLLDDRIAGAGADTTGDIPTLVAEQGGRRSSVALEEGRRSSLEAEGFGKPRRSRASIVRTTAEAVGVVEISPLSEVDTIVGKLQGQFGCVYNRQPGTLYAGSTALYFVGSRFFFPTKLAVQSVQIRQVKMVKGKPKSDVNSSGELLDDDVTLEDIIMEQGIEVWTRDGVSHTFLGMENPDQVWASLVALRNHSSTAGPASRPFAMRRMNSDPTFTSHTSGYDLMSPSMDEQDIKAIGSGAPPVLTSTAPRQQELAPPVLTEVELKLAWSELLSKKNQYKTRIIEDHEFGCSLDKFFQLYIADGAEYNFAKFLESTGDRDVKTSPWKPTRKDGKIVRSRVVRSIHPVNAPLAPPEAKARKEQTCHRFGDLGIVMETKTFVDDVPMTDCFFVKERLVVASKKDNRERVLVTIEFELEFVKSTMFRGIITKTTTAEMTKFSHSWKDFMAHSMSEEPVKPEAMEKRVEKEIVTEEPAFFHGGFAVASLTHALLLFVILLQLWILLEMYTMKRAILRLESVESQHVFFQE